jgi:L-aspartate oxidase
MIKTDYLVIGSGIAGLVFALKAAADGATVAVVTKGGLDDSATAWAQGGVAAVWSAADSFEQHIQDTLTAGAGLCHRDVVELVVREGPARVRELIDWGVKFSVKEGAPDRDFELGLEAGHSQRRILHAGDITGSQIEAALIAQARRTPGIALYEHHIAVDLITTGKIEQKFAGSRERCWGAYVLDKQAHAIRNFLAGTVVLATGGAGKVYLYTSNPDVATGDGVAMAYRCGATIANMEFIQFHPTCLYHSQAKSFLISEALRGEGGILRLANGTAFMEKYDSRKELAPRDIVARAIDNELKVTGDDCVFLDMTARPEKFLKKRFPNIYATCVSFGIDMARQPIPVVPAAHYSCGGVLTDAHAATSIPGLYAIGETACTGLHGANRLASNSLLEALVFAERAYRHSRAARAALCAFPAIPSWDPGNARDSDESVVVSQNWDEIRHFMWNYVGIVRSDKRLARAVRRIELLQQEIQQYYWDFTVTSDLIELRNIATVAELIVRGAQQRHESRGLHFTIDHPAVAPEARDTLLRRFGIPA